MIGSLGDFPLSDAQKRVVFEMTVDALGVVEEEDMPAIVRTLLASTTKGAPLRGCTLCLISRCVLLDSARTIIAAIRSATAELTVMKHASLTLEIILNALRLHPNAGMYST